MRRLYRFFVPPRRPDQGLPLLPLEISSRNLPWGEVPRASHHEIMLLKIYGLARTDEDAYRLLKRYPGHSVDEIREATQRQRRFMPWRKRMWRRLKKLVGTQ
jgi:hypothetical protein